MLNKLLDIIFQRKSIQTENVTAVLHRLFGEKCSVCSNELDGHLFALMGQFLLDQTPDKLDFTKKSFDGNEWGKLTNIDDWDPERNYVQIYLIRCPKLSGMAAFLVISYADMNSDDAVLMSKTVRENDLEDIVGGLNWKQL